ncbi:MAG: branched-chain amino acid ABC transporter permease, partial [Dehalococcoidia bacterium]
FAHGDSMMLAAYVAFFALTGTVIGERTDTKILPWSLDDLPEATSQIPWVGPGDFSFGYGLLLALLIAVVAAAATFIVLDRLIYRPLRRRRSGIVIFAIASLGVAIAMRSLMLIFWASRPRFYVSGEALIRDSTDLPFDVSIRNDQIFIFSAAIILAALLYLLLFRTKLGKAMRAMSDNPDLARVSGINTEQIVAWTWIIGGALVAIAGVLLALQAQLQPELGFILLLPLFAATILGGIGSPQGAFVGAMIVGISQEVFAVVGPQDFDISPAYKFSVAFVILILILLLRPRGLFGAKT